MSTRPIQESVTGWIFEKFESDFSIERDTSSLMTILKVSTSTIVHPIFAVAALVETVARLIIFFLAKALNFLIPAQTDLAKWMNNEMILPLAGSVVINANLMSEQFTQLALKWVPAHINEYNVTV
jgi:hypothetical protein